MVTSTVQERDVDQELAAVLWAATDKVASKGMDRDQLQEDDSHQVRLMITGEIDGQAVHRSMHGTLSVGANQERAVSATPDQPTLVALILSKLNAATRDKVLTELPEQFAKLGTWPEVSPDLIESAEQMLRNIRSKKTIKVRGNVRFNYDATKSQPTANPIRRRGPSRNGNRKTTSTCHETRNCTE